MKKIALALLSLLTIATLVILIIALTNKSSDFYNYRLAIGISFLVFGGILRQQISSNRKNAGKESHNPKK